jgi:hypothetical protein
MSNEPSVGDHVLRLDKQGPVALGQICELEPDHVRVCWSFYVLPNGKTDEKTTRTWVARAAEGKRWRRISSAAAECIRDAQPRTLQRAIWAVEKINSAELPREWRWVTDPAWTNVRCARRKGLRGDVDVYLTEDERLVIDGHGDAPAAVVRAVLGVSKVDP